MMKPNIAGPWIAAIVAMLGIVFFALAVTYTFRQQEHVNDQLCQGQVENRVAIRTTWNAARNILLQNQDTIEGRQAVNQLFDGILEAIPSLECVDSKPIPKEE